MMVGISLLIYFYMTTKLSHTCLFKMLRAITQKGCSSIFLNPLKLRSASSAWRKNSFASLPCNVGIALIAVAIILSPIIMSTANL